MLRALRRTAFLTGVIGVGLTVPVQADAVPTRPASPASTAPSTTSSTAPATNPSTSPATGPSTAPATNPATGSATSAAFTQSTPRDALKFFAAALRDGDADRLRNAVLTVDKEEDGMVMAIADMARSLKHLHDAAALAFGPEAAAKFTDDTAANFEQTLARIDAADVALDADTAVIRYADAKDNPYELRRVGELWKVPATQFTHGAGAEILQRRVAELRRQAEIVRELGQEIADGKHKSAEAAGLAWRSKMMAALSGEGRKPGSAGPQTSPATKPEGS